MHLPWGGHLRDIDGQILLSASDLMRFAGCAHATMLDLAHLRGEMLTPREDSEDAALLQKHGHEHEASYLEEIKASGRSVVEIARRHLAVDVEATRAALTAGAPVVFQGAFLSAFWGGWSDFLERIESPSALGPFSYEVTDTKLKRRPHPRHVLQLALYSDLLAEVQGKVPEHAHVQLGDGTRWTFRLSDYAAYARSTRRRLETFIANPTPTRPAPCSDCGLCRWGDHCQETWDREDSLFNVAGIAKGQVEKLEAAGIATMARLAEHRDTVRGMATGMLDRLRAQARLQQARKTGSPTAVLRPSEPGRGFDLLPEPQRGDVFYDIEGDPHFEGGLEYLHGVWADGAFRSFWAHDHAAEKVAVADLLDFFRQQLASFPTARIYHYAPYEITALRRLTARYGIGEALLDRMLRERRFVDLYAVVRGGIIASEPDYSLKSLEVFYGLERKGEVKTAGGSIVAYERWRESDDQALLDEIEDYNRIDCISTEKLRDWLVSVRSSEMAWPSLGADATERETDDDKDEAELRARLSASRLPSERQQMLFDLGRFHQRELKPARWAVFDSVSHSDDEILDDLDALGGLEAASEIEPVKRSFARRYRFPPQESKLRSGDKKTVSSHDSPPVTVHVDEIDHRAGSVTVRAGPGKDHLLADHISLHPDWPLDTRSIAAAVHDVVSDQCSGRQYRAVDDLISAAAPRLSGAAGDILGDADPVEGTIAAVHRMRETVLPIQGPPGTGKTYVTARAILSLVKEGHRVGVASTSHEAIRNVMLACVEAQDGKLMPDMVHKVSRDEDFYPADFPVRATKDNEDAAEGHDIVGGTVFFFSRDENIQAFDWLFVDEAGQVSLANMVAMGRAARNIVLVGDPRQLPQVIQGAHPHPADLSCLEWMQRGEATIPPDRGIFLPVTRRMHPAVCRFISVQVYAGRLGHHPGTACQAVTETPYPSSGAFWVSVEHEGNAQTADAEVKAIRRAVDNLLRGNWTDQNGSTGRMTTADIIVVAPYNAQVNALRDSLPESVRVGTVDKFQGQEAPVCLVSMTASSAEDIPRGVEFLYSLNRINVAVSRAKALALVFGSLRLREAKCETVDRMQLVNTLCALQVFEPTEARQTALPTLPKRSLNRSMRSSAERA